MLHLQFQDDLIDWPAWIQASAAVFAAIGLMITLFLQWKSTNIQIIAFDEQTKVNQAILEGSQRDYERYLYEIMPKLEFKANVDYNENTIVFKVISHEHPAYEFSVELNSSVAFISKDIKERKIILGKETSLPFTVWVKNEVLHKSLDEYGHLHIIFHFWFSDRLGNKYLQTANFIYTTNDLLVLPPILRERKS
jgi:hypothetical protein